MSITDATTSLDTAWTEQSTVTITAGHVADLAGCISEVQSKLKRGTIGATSKPTSTEVERWLVRAKEELAELKGFTFNRKYAAFNTVADQYRYSLPPDYNGGEVTIRDQNNNRNITVWPQSVFDKMYPDPSEEASDEPLFACIKNMEIWFIPPPKAAYSLEVDYDRSGAETTADDFTWLPEIERFRCCDFAISESFTSLHQWNEAKYYRDRWDQGLLKATRADGKRKWKAINYQIINVFQEKAIRDYQG